MAVYDLPKVRAPVRFRYSALFELISCLEFIGETSVNYGLFIYSTKFAGRRVFAI